jgi:hypothetical protein
MAPQSEDRNWLAQLGGWSLPMRVAGLFVLFLTYFGLLAPVAWLQFDSLGLVTLAVATGVCLMTGWVALVATATVAPPEKAGLHVLVGMAVRMALPFAVCLLVMRQKPAWIDAGFAWFLVGAFLLNLLLDTLMAVGQLHNLPTTQPPKTDTSKAMLPK